MDPGSSCWHLFCGGGQGGSQQRAVNGRAKREHSLAGEEPAEVAVSEWLGLRACEASCWGKGVPGGRAEAAVSPATYWAWNRAAGATCGVPWQAGHRRPGSLERGVTLSPLPAPTFPQAWAPTGLRDDIAGPRVLCSAVSSGRGDGGASSSVKGSLSKEAARTRRQEDKSGTNCPNYVRQPYFLLGTARRGPDRSVPARTPPTHTAAGPPDTLEGSPLRDAQSRSLGRVPGAGQTLRVDSSGPFPGAAGWGQGKRPGLSCSVSIPRGSSFFKKHICIEFREEVRGRQKHQ